MQQVEDRLRRQAERYASSGMLEVRWAERALRKQARNMERELRSAIAKYNGSREYMVVVYAHMGTTYTNVQVTSVDGHTAYTGLRYACKAEGQVPCGVPAMFPFTRVRDFVVLRKNATITRR